MFKILLSLLVQSELHLIPEFLNSQQCYFFGVSGDVPLGHNLIHDAIKDFHISLGVDPDSIQNHFLLFLTKRLF